MDITIQNFFDDCLLEINHPIAISKMERNTQNWPRYDCPFSSKGNQNVAYKIHTNSNSAVLTIKCHKCHEKPLIFKSGKKTRSTPIQRQKITLENKKKEDKEEKLRKSASIKMKSEWDSSKPCTNHSYFDRKSLSILECDGLRIDHSGNILCPIRLITGELISTQKIPVQGKKKFHYKTSPKDGFHIFGDINEHEAIYFAEGIATGLTIKNATGSPVIVVYGKNFNSIAPIISKAYPNKKLIYCCDLPSKGEKASSEENAKKAICLVGGYSCLPDFSIIPVNLCFEITRSDWNDLFILFLKLKKTYNDALAEVHFQLLNKIQENAQMKNTQKEDLKNNAENIIPLKRSINETDYPDKNKGRVLNTYGNLQYLLDRFNISIKWNIMSHFREVTMPSSEKPLFSDDIENAGLREIINIAELNSMPISRIDDHLTTLAQHNSYHPIVECIRANVWDGTKRLDEFINTIKTPNDKISHQLIFRWMISAVAAAFSKNGFSSQGVLVLQGEQNIGKTRWVKSLDPTNGSCNAIKEGALLDPSNKDSVITCASHWIVELGELDATFRKADIARIKSHTTNQIDIVRFPYAQKNSRLPRRTVFVATVNESNFLVDDTGNRRWWTIEALEIDLNHELDMQQVWAEAYHYWDKGQQYWLTEEELQGLNNINTEHEQIDPLVEKVNDFFDWSPGWQNHNIRIMGASEVLELIGYNKPTKSDATRMGTILQKFTGKKPIRRKHTLPRQKTKSWTPIDT